MSSHPFDPQQPSPPSAYVPPAGYPEAVSGATPPQYSAPSGYAAPQQPYAGQPYAAAPQYPPVYGQQPYSDQPQQNSNGSTFATLSIVFAAIGFFFLGLILGPVALVLAHKAEKLGTDAKIGKILGWITTIFSVIYMAFILIINM
jgi:hypothetical protein